MNFSLPNIILGLIGIVGGFAITYYAYDLNHKVLFLSWAENKWGPGMGTTTYRLLGVGIAFFGFFVFIGIIDLFTLAFGGTPTSSNPQGGIQKSTPVQVRQPTGESLLSQ
jgi:hypothetical protein